jgi:hypothetical protein
MKEARIRVLTNEPDYSDYQDLEYDWSSSVYEDVKEIIPMDIPEPKGKYVTLSHYFDANLYHDMVTGRSITAILHFLNQNPDELVLKETSYCLDYYFWFRIHHCKDYYRSDCRPPNDTSLSWRSYSRTI